MLLSSIALNKSTIHTTSKHQDHDLEPSGGRNGLERREATRGHVGELQVLRHGEVARHADTRFNRNDLAADFRILQNTNTKYKKISF